MELQLASDESWPAPSAKWGSGRAFQVGPSLRRSAALHHQRSTAGDCDQESALGKWHCLHANVSSALRRCKRMAGCSEPARSSGRVIACRSLGASLQGSRKYLQERLEAIGFRVLDGQVRSCNNAISWTRKLHRSPGCWCPRAKLLAVAMTEPRVQEAATTCYFCSVQHVGSPV